MQTTHLINHSLELRLALSLVAAISLFAIVKAAYFIDEKLSALLKRRQETPSRNTVGAATAMAGDTLTLSLDTGGDVVISKGLASGDQVIVDGVVKLGPGAPVQISAPAPAGQAAPASNAKQGG